MSPHWRLAARYAAVFTVPAVAASLLVGFGYGGAYSGALLYGVAVGLVAVLSRALAVSMLTGPSAGHRALGGALLTGRYGFVAVALALPVYLEAWPVVAMAAGFGGVYLSENVVLVPGVFRKLTRGAEAAPGGLSGAGGDGANGG